MAAKALERLGPAVAAAPSVALKMHTEASAADGEPMDVIDTTTEQKPSGVEQEGSS